MIFFFEGKIEGRKFEIENIYKAMNRILTEYNTLKNIKPVRVLVELRRRFSAPSARHHHKMTNTVSNILCT